ncbi:hypothetical protein G5V59_23855 [Nocardioides sp. W3-2-3]|uniref:hypothetical protein n=1 Tax=Nocardioides convexus TaxID=2712224 RepID=UPI0024185053|nr:hypothetical protein [Nocardioides convexus]NHA01725.1 hypothetical protein [Nocardioides convexus]
MGVRVRLRRFSPWRSRARHPAPAAPAAPAASPGLRASPTTACASDAPAPVRSAGRSAPSYRAAGGGRPARPGPRRGWPHRLAGDPRRHGRRPDGPSLRRARGRAGRHRPRGLRARRAGPGVGLRPEHGRADGDAEPDEPRLLPADGRRAPLRRPAPRPGDARGGREPPGRGRHRVREGRLDLRARGVRLRLPPARPAAPLLQRRQGPAGPPRPRRRLRPRRARRRRLGLPAGCGARCSTHSPPAGPARAGTPPSSRRTTPRASTSSGRSRSTTPSASATTARTTSTAASCSAPTAARLVAGYGPLQWRVDPAARKMLGQSEDRGEDGDAEEDGYRVEWSDEHTTVRDASGRTVLDVDGDPWFGDGAGGYIRDGQIGAGSGVYDLDTGEAVWTRPDLAGYDEYGTAYDWSWALDRRNVVVEGSQQDASTGTSDGTLLDGRTGRTVLALSDKSAPMLRTDDAVVVVSDGEVSAYDATTGEARLEPPGAGRVLLRPRARRRARGRGQAPAWSCSATSLRSAGRARARPSRRATRVGRRTARPAASRPPSCRQRRGRPTAGSPSPTG